jgi:hypothetical protein
MIVAKKKFESVAGVRKLLREVAETMTWRL